MHSLRLGIRELTLAALFLVPISLLAAEPQPERYTLFVELRAPHESNRARLQKMLKDEGHESYAERDGELSLVLTAAQLEKLFQGRVQMRTVAASASSRMITQPTLESYTIPARFRKLIQRVYFDPQRG